MRSDASRLVLEGNHDQISSIRAIFQVFAILALTGGISYSQQLTATLTGTAYDQTQSAIPGATIEVKNEASGDTRRTTANESGYFTVTALRPGTYTVTVTAQGFDAWQQTGVTLNQGDNRTLPNIALGVGGTTTKVDVVSGAEAVAPTDTPEVSSTLNATLVNNIPIQGRDAGEFLNIMPGMAMTGGTSNNTSFTGRT